FELPNIPNASQSPDTGILVYANRGTIEVLDPLASHRWTLATSPGLTYTTPQIAADAHTVIARRVVTDREKLGAEGRAVRVLLAWRFPTPSTPDDTAAWLGRMTNATVDPKTSNLAWP